LSVCAFETYREKNNGKEEKEEEERVKTLLFSLCRADRRDVRLSSLSLSLGVLKMRISSFSWKTRKKKNTRKDKTNTSHM